MFFSCNTLIFVCTSRDNSTLLTFFFGKIGNLQALKKREKISRNPHRGGVRVRGGGKAASPKEIPPPPSRTNLAITLKLIKYFN